jgi:hypothetical protein
MNLKTVHYVQGALAFLAGSALAVAQGFPQYATQAHLIAAVCGVALANLGLLSDGVVQVVAVPASVAQDVAAKTSDNAAKLAS